MVGSEQEVAGVSVSLPGSLTLAGVFFWLLGDWNFLYKGYEYYKMSSRILPMAIASILQAPGIHVGGNRVDILRKPTDRPLAGYVCLGMLGGAELPSMRHGR